MNRLLSAVRTGLIVEVVAFHWYVVGMGTGMGTGDREESCQRPAVTVAGAGDRCPMFTSSIYYCNPGAYGVMYHLNKSREASLLLTGPPPLGFGVGIGNTLVKSDAWFEYFAVVYSSSTATGAMMFFQLVSLFGIKEHSN